jgi:hypothetical protein
VFELAHPTQGGAEDELGGKQHVSRFMRSALENPVEKHARRDPADLSLIPGS